MWHNGPMAAAILLAIGLLLFHGDIAKALAKLAVLWQEGGEGAREIADEQKKIETGDYGNNTNEGGTQQAPDENSDIYKGG